MSVEVFKNCPIIRTLLPTKKQPRDFASSQKCKNVSLYCSPWVDYVESHEGDSTIGLVMFVNCFATILANVVLFAVIFSNKELREQVILRVAMLSLKIFSVSVVFYEQGGGLVIKTRSQINQSIKHPKGCSKFSFRPPVRTVTRFSANPISDQRLPTFVLAKGLRLSVCLTRVRWPEGP